MEFGDRRLAGGQELQYPFMLYASVPNPFSTTTNLRYSLRKEGMVSLREYNITGRLVRTLAERWQEAGRYSAGWDGRDAHGRSVPNGVYVCKLRASGEQMTRKVTLLR